MSGLTDESWPIKKRGMAWESLLLCRVTHCIALAWYYTAWRCDEPA